MKSGLSGNNEDVGKGEGNWEGTAKQEDFIFDTSEDFDSPYYLFEQRPDSNKGRNGKSQTTQRTKNKGRIRRKDTKKDEEKKGKQPTEKRQKTRKENHQKH